MRVILFGADGNMGKRYKCILHYLGHEVAPLEVNHKDTEMRLALTTCDKIIIATPTDTHLEIIRSIYFARSEPEKPLDILCEKPVVKTANDLLRLRHLCENALLNVCCVNQYAFLLGINKGTSTFGSTYDYYNTGNDGSHWDCFQVYALSKGPVSIETKSPIRRCQINGVEAPSGAIMDRAYVDMLVNFLGANDKAWNLDFIESVTHKILAVK